MNEKQTRRSVLIISVRGGKILLLEVYINKSISYFRDMIALIPFCFALPYKSCD